VVTNGARGEGKEEEDMKRPGETDKSGAEREGETLFRKLPPPEKANPG